VSLPVSDRSNPEPLGPLLIGLQGLEISNEESHWLCDPAVGGVVLFSRNYRDTEQLSALTAAIGTVADRDLLICVDHEGGRVQRFKQGFTRLPPLAILGRMYAESPTMASDYAYRHGRVMATELLLCGVDLSFAPVLDIGLCSVVIGDRAFAEDPTVIIELSRSYIAGMHDAGMCVTGKHFPGHGSVKADSHSADVSDPRSLEKIEQVDLRPFAALAGELDAIMMAHVVYPAVDERPAGYSPFWIKSMLRQKLGFRGTVFSDDLGMFAAKIAGKLTDRARLSLQAGCDAVLVCDPDDVRQLLLDSGHAPISKEQANADTTLKRLKGKLVATQEEMETVGEWRQWKKSIEQLEQSKWA